MLHFDLIVSINGISVMPCDYEIEKFKSCYEYDIIMSENCSTQVLISKLQALCRITLSSANIVPEYQCHSELQ